MHRLASLISDPAFIRSDSESARGQEAVQA